MIELKVKIINEEKIEVKIYAEGYGNRVERHLADLLCDTIDITSNEFINQVYNLNII